jgi:hypothetical protein
MAKSTNNKPRGDPTGLPSWVKAQLCKLVDARPRPICSGAEAAGLPKTVSGSTGEDSPDYQR